MNWFPRFLNIWPAALAAGVVIPTLLVLYFLKLRRRELAVSSTLLWKKAIQDLQVNSPFQKLRKNLLLLLQMLLLILLLLALSRPITFFTPGAGKNTVLIIDRSASMAANDLKDSRLAEAKKQAKELVDTLERGGTAMVIAFDDRAETVQPWTSDTVALKNAIDGIKQTDRKSRLKQAYQLADAQTHFSENQLRSATDLPDVFVYSDGKVLDANELSVKGKVTYKQIGTDTAGNIAIVSLSAKRNYEHPNEVEIFATLADYGTEPVDADVELWVSPIDPTDPGKDNFEFRTAHVVKLLPARWNEERRAEAAKQGMLAKEQVLFQLDITTAATVRVVQKNTKNDAMPADDMAQIVLPPPKPLSVLVVSEGNYFLEHCLDSLSLKNRAQMTPPEFETKQPKDFDVIVFDRYAPKQLPPTGNFIYIGCIAPGLKIKPVLEDGKQVLLTNQLPLDWKRDHPILKFISLKKLFVAEAMKVDLPLEAEVLVEGEKGPLIVLHREGRSMHLMLTFDVLQSRWPVDMPSFPVFFYYALQYMALGGEMDIRQSLEPGSSPRIPRANLQRAGNDLKAIRLFGPNISRELEIPPTGDFALPPLDAVGVYRMDPVIPQYERIAVNLLDSNESDLVPSTKSPGNIGEAAVVTGGKARVELWWWLVACGALPLLMVEWWVYTRRVHL